MTKKRPVLLVDTYNMAFRMGWTFKNFEDSMGNPTGVLYGVVKEVIRYINKFKPRHVIMCFDSFSAYRKEIYPEYKESRGKKMTAEQQDIRETVHSQIQKLPKALKLLPVRIVKVKGEEADDLIAHYALTKSLFKGRKRIIISNDQDMLQLVDKSTVVWSPTREEFITRKNFEEIVGCKVENFVDLKCLMGDKSDGIPGIYGIGPKKGAQLLNAYGPLERAIASQGAEDIPTAMFNMIEKVRDSWDIILRNRKLMDLSKRKIIVKKKDIKRGSWKRKKFKKLCSKHGFNSILFALDAQSKNIKKVKGK